MNRKQRERNRETARRLQQQVVGPVICTNCEKPGSHFCPPCFGEAGFFGCKPAAVPLPLTVTDVAAKLAQLRQEELAAGSDEEAAHRSALDVLVDTVLDDAARGEDLDTHSYWNTDTDFYVDFYRHPRLVTLKRLREAVKVLREAAGVTVHLSVDE